MARPKSEQPTPAELDVLRILWERGPSTVREVLRVLQDRGRDRAYTSVMSLLNVMFDKKLVQREPDGRAFRYAAASPPDKTLGDLVGDLCDRAFDGSASTLVAHLLEGSDPDNEELVQIRKALEAYMREKESP